MDEIRDYLARNGYESIEDWAKDSDMENRGGVWYDSDGNEINVEEYLGTLISELGL